MKRLWVLAPLALAGTLLAARASDSAEKKLRLAVLALKAEGVEPTLAETVDETLTADLGRAGKYEVIGRSEIEAMAGFQSERLKLGCTGDTACLAEIGGALGVDRLVFGSLGRAGSLYVLNTKLLEISKAKVIARDTETVSSADGLIAAASRSAQILLGDLPVPLAATAEVTTSSGGGLRHTAWPWVTLVLGAAAAGVGGYFEFDANNQYNINQNIANSTDQRNGAASTGKTDVILADSLFGAGLVLGLVGIGMFVFGGGG
jgi:TolB-like protein